MSTHLDPMAAAVQDAEASQHYFGKLEVDAQFVRLIKGQPKQIWQEGDPIDGRTTEIVFRLNPLDISGLNRMVERSVMSNSGEWSKIVWPSLRDLGCKTPHDAKSKWVHAQMVPSGRKWFNKDGEEVFGSTFKFLKLFTTQSDCIAAWEAQFGGKSAHTPEPALDVPFGNEPAKTVSQNDSERAVALSFLAPIVNANKSDLGKLAQMLASMSPLNKYFTVDSPEVQALLKAA